jgi:hypothetical protein
MSERGGQPGNTNAAKGRRWTDAINRALARRCKSEGIAELDRLADKFLDTVEAMADREGQFGPNPSVAGFQELADRLEGKPPQTLAVGGDPEGEPLRTQVVVNFPKDAE